MSTKLFVIRHGSVEKDPALAPELWPLSDLGRAKTEELARQEDWTGVVKLYHSPERKAQETGTIISRITDIPLQPLDDLRDVCPLVSLSSGPRVVGEDSPFYLGENRKAATDRIVQCIHDLAHRHHGQSIAIISHARILALLYSHILGRKITLLEWLSVPLPGLSVIDVDQWRVERGFLSREITEFSK